MRWLAAVVVGAVVFAAACGGGDGESDVLADAEDHLAELQSGDMALALTASGGDASVGFRVEGQFSFESGGELPLLDLTYTRTAGEEIEASVGADGEVGWVVVDGDVTLLDPDELAELRLAGGDGGVPDLDLAAWMIDPTVQEDGERTTVTGELDVVEMLEDLQRLVAEVEGAEVPDELSGEEADRLRAAVTAANVVVETEGDEHRLRSLEATVEFGADTPRELRDALGPYAGATLELTLTLDELTGDLIVERPSA